MNGSAADAAVVLGLCEGLMNTASTQHTNFKARYDKHSNVLRTLYNVLTVYFRVWHRWRHVYRILRQVCSTMRITRTVMIGVCDGCCSSLVFCYMFGQ